MSEPINTFKIASVMIRYGGSFVKHLGEALLCADEENSAKIQSTWPEYWERYSEMAKQLEERETEECRVDITDDIHRDVKEDR